MSDYLPNHLLANVLVRLPFESLIRSRCVSKSWRALIDSPDFIKLHFERSHLQTNSHHDVKIVALNQEYQFYTLDLDPEGGNSTAIVKHLSNPFDYPEGHEVILVGSCTGLLCLMYPITEKIILWNPWIQKSWELPSLPVEHSMDFDVSSRLGFGFESVNDDYKVVNLMRLWDTFKEEEGKSTSYRDEFYVYSLKLNSWRRIWDFELKLPNYSYDFPQEYVLANGALHWIMKEKDAWYGASNIVAFDLSTEEFQKMACPRYPEDAFEQSLKIVNGFLCLLSYHGVSGRYAIDLWLMENYGVDKPWTKLISVKMPYDIFTFWRVTPLAYSKFNRQLLMQINWGKLAIYDVETESTRDVDTNISGAITCDASCVCVGSLVRPYYSGGID